MSTARHSPRRIFSFWAESQGSKVEVSVDLFSKIKFVPNENGVQYAAATGELDREPVNSWAFYATGFVEGCVRGCVHSVAEGGEPTVPKQP